MRPAAKQTYTTRASLFYGLVSCAVLLVIILVGAGRL